MLFNWAKNKKDERQILEFWANWQYKNGHKQINSDNFIELGYDYIRYKVENKTYKGFFTKDEQENIFKVLDYKEGRIITIN
jgi:hypothetical protein